MPQVTIHLPGSHTEFGNNEREWSFNATVDGRVGIITLVVPGTYSEEQAARACKRVLEFDPSTLDGIASTNLGGGEVNGGGGDEHVDIPVVLASEE